MQVFVIMNDAGIMKNVYVNAKNWLTNGRLFIWNPSICECECNKSCDIEQYLDYKNCKYRKKLISKLVENVVKILMEMKWFIMELPIIMKKYAILVHYT